MYAISYMTYDIWRIAYYILYVARDLLDRMCYIYTSYMYIWNLTYYVSYIYISYYIIYISCIPYIICISITTYK